MSKANKSSCCVPAIAASTPLGVGTVSANKALNPPVLQAAAIPGAKRPVFGTSTPRISNDGEETRHAKPISPFRMTKTTVTNAEFAAFIDATGYVTEAETIGWSFVFWSNVPSDITTSQGVAGSEWWRKIDGAYWRDVNGPGTKEAHWHPDHPAVHVSWNDASAYATWIGGRLPNEAEWEHAARGGFGDVPYPWGADEPDDTDFQPCNIWQGDFPKTNTLADGYKTTAPAQSFAPNRYGLFNIVGNVWEWTADFYRIKSLKKVAKDRARAMVGYRVAKGGSFLCHKSYCWRYRIAARSGNPPDSATPHMGFRVAFDEPQADKGRAA